MYQILLSGLWNSFSRSSSEAYGPVLHFGARVYVKEPRDRDRKRPVETK